MNRFTQLQTWYVSHCNGEWEHTYGVKIDSLDTGRHRNFAIHAPSRSRLCGSMRAVFEESRQGGQFRQNSGALQVLFGFCHVTLPRESNSVRFLRMCVRHRWYETQPSQSWAHDEFSSAFRDQTSGQTVG